jgi:DNA-binding Xre family transcriptional regulator
MRNKIKIFLEKRSLSAYQFVKDTGLAPSTGYGLAADPSYIPSAKTMTTICDTYKIQPGEILEWVEAIESEAIN